MVAQSRFLLVAFGQHPTVTPPDGDGPEGATAYYGKKRRIMSRMRFQFCAVGGGS